MAELIKDGMTMEREELVTELVSKVKGEFAAGGPAGEMGLEAYDMGVEYAKTHRFNNSSKYHNFKYTLEDGDKINSSEFYHIFTTRLQTHAYIDAETNLKEYFLDDQEVLFHLVRDQRFGINGVFKAVTSPREICPLSFSDYVLAITCFGAGYMKNR